MANYRQAVGYRQFQLFDKILAIEQAGHDVLFTEVLELLLQFRARSGLAADNDLGAGLAVDTGRFLCPLGGIDVGNCRRGVQRGCSGFVPEHQWWCRGQHPTSEPDAARRVCPWQHAR